MILRLLRKLKLIKKKTYPKRSLGDFMINAPLEEKKAVYAEIIRRSNARQRKIVEEAERILAERERSKTK
jgi:hypothetical protein